MALEHITQFPPSKHLVRTETCTPDEIDFPSEEPFEDHVAETIRHLEARMALFLITRTARENISVGSEQFIYYDPKDPKKCLAPDVFVKLDSRVRDFDKWLTWRRGAPELAVEIVSVTDRMKLSWKEKFERYEASGIQELVRFDPWKDECLHVWDRIDGQLVERAPDSLDTYECKTLQLYWAYEMSDEFGLQLRPCRDREGKDLLPTPAETMLKLEKKLAKVRRSQAREGRKRLLLEQKRLLSEQKRLLSEQKRRDEVEARQRAEEKQREAEAEVQRLRAELQRLQGA